MSGLPGRAEGGARSRLFANFLRLSPVRPMVDGPRQTACHASPSPWVLGPPVSQESPQALRFRQNPFISNMGRGAAALVRGRNFFALTRGHSRNGAKVKVVTVRNPPAPAPARQCASSFGNRGGTIQRITLLRQTTDRKNSVRFPRESRSGEKVPSGRVSSAQGGHGWTRTGRMGARTDDGRGTEHAQKGGMRRFENS